MAEQLKATFLLIDDRLARAVAVSRGFHVLGTIGLLIQAKRKGFVPEIAPLLDGLRHELNFFSSDSLLIEVLEQVGETP